MSPSAIRSKRLTDYVEIKHGFAFSSKFFGTKGDYILLTPGNFAEAGGFRDLGSAQKRFSGPVSSNFILKKGDVLIAMTEQSPGLLGSTIRVPESDLYLHNQRLGLLSVKKPDRVSLNYLYHAFNAPLVRKEIAACAAGTKVKHTSPTKLAEVEVFLPTLEDQERTADLLDEWDTAIQKTEQLVTAKEHSFHSLMQRVLNAGQHPARRLSTFVDRVTRKNTEGNGHPLTISGADGLVSQAQYYGKRIAAESTEHYTLIKRGEFAYNRSSSSGYPFGAIKRLDVLDEGVVSTLYLCFALNEDAPLSDYFAYYCESGGFNRQIYQVAQEGARNHGLLNVTAHDFFSMSMPIPSREEQTRAVTILNAATREISLLRSQLSALRTQKRGLMQKLLTGQWRLQVKQQEALTP